MIKLCLLVATLTCVAFVLKPVHCQPLSMCPLGWNETDYRCYRLFDDMQRKFADADEKCSKLGLGARVAYPADYYELNLLGAIANGLTIWLGYVSDGKTYRTIYNATGFPNQFEVSSTTGTDEEKTTEGNCGIYKPVKAADNTIVGYQLSNQNPNDQAYTICQMSYCSPLATDPVSSPLWIEYRLRCYLLARNASTFGEAQSFCASNAATLATPDSAEENDFLTRVYDAEGSDRTRWIGVKSEKDSSGITSNWMNVAKNVMPPALTFFPKSSLLPTSNNSCTFMNGMNGVWDSTDCSTSKPFICRRIMGSLSYSNCTKSTYGKYTSWTADCILSPGSQTRRWRKCISGCNPRGCLQITAKYCQYLAKWSTWGPWGGCSKPTKGTFQMASTPCLFNGQRTRGRQCMCGTDLCGGCGSPGDSAGATQSANCNIFISRLCPTQECTYCSTTFTHSHCFEDGSADSLTNNFRCVCDLGYNRKRETSRAVPMGCTLGETNDDTVVADCNCDSESAFNECETDYASCTSEQLCQYPVGGPHTCYCLPGYRKIPSGGCVAASRIPPQCKIVSGSSFLKDSRGNPLIPYKRGYICTCGETELLVKAGYSTKNSTTGEEAAARIMSRNKKYMCYCLRATVSPFLRVDPMTSRPVETKFNLTRQIEENFPECEQGYFDNNMTYPKIPADLFVDVDAKLADLEGRTYFKCTGADGFNSRFEFLTQPVLGEALSTPLEQPEDELAALTRLLSVDEAAIDLFQSMLSPDCETQRSYLKYIDVMSGTEVFLGNVSDKDVSPTFVSMQCGNWSFPPEAVDRSKYPGIYQPLIAHCYVNATKFKSKMYNATLAAKNATTLEKFIKNALKSKDLGFSYTQDFTLPPAMLNAGVMSISTNPAILRMPVGVYLTIWFPLYDKPVGLYQPHCTFYDFGYITGPTWRTGDSGCTSEWFNSSNGRGYVKCKCDHMTIFSATMIEVIPSSYLWALMVLNAIVIGGSALSIVCLALTLLIYIQLRRFSTERIGIMMLCFAVAITQALLLAGAKLTTSPSTCRIISILLHFFGLLTFSLIGSLSMAMYFRFVARFKRGWKNMGAYYGLGFALPTITVVVSAGGFYDSYGVGYSCWMDMDGLMKWAFFGPFMVIGILSLYLLIKIAPVLYKVKGTKMQSFSQAEVYGVEFKYGVQKREKIEVIFDVSKKKFWGLIILLVILTVTWILGIMSMQYDSIYFDYGFAIFNASQGFFIFVMFCLREEEVRILCCAGCMSKQQPAGKISWLKFVDIYERYFALVLHNEEEEKKQTMTFNEFVSQEYRAGAIMPEEIVAMGPREYVSAQRGLQKPNYLLSCSCCFPVKTAPMPMAPIAGAAMPPPVDLAQKLFVVGPDGQLMCLDKDGENAAEIMAEIGTQRPGSVAVMMGSAGPGGRSSAGVERPATSAKPTVPEPPVAENWVAPPTLFPEFPDSDEEGEVAADIAAEVKINRDMKAYLDAAPGQKAPSARVPSARVPSARVPSARVPSGRVPSGRVSSARAVPEETEEQEQEQAQEEETVMEENENEDIERSASRISSARPTSGRPQSGIQYNEEDGETERPSSSMPEDEQPRSARKKKSKNDTSELDPLDLDD